MPESDHKGEWTLPICTRCGGIVSFRLDGGCTCDPSHAKIGRSITVVPRSQLDAVVEALEFLLSRFNLVLEGKRAPEVTHSILQAETALRAAALPTEQPEEEKE